MTDSTENRDESLQRLHATLTPQQILDLKLVIQTAEVQGDYFYNEEDGSHWSDDVNTTLNQLAMEFDPPPLS